MHCASDYPIRLELTDFHIVGMLDCVIFAEFADIVPVETEDFDWGG
ncbi:hypothetical protein J2S03_002593 [Alicyclobacillus cycloheptanicus]|uniref:Uncharacterized protein n=1 Tax=Alicyclobacillus cycloheptanicus TaxID=1457 RepID=A0ABT9XLY9_9BACL|nr:hypothetical protein [Alicyclobacillus cycloheptanicus]